MWKTLINRKGVKGLILGASLLLIVAVLAPTHANVRETLVYVSPATYTVPSIGSTFSVNVSIQGVTNLKGWQFKLYYPNSILNGTTVVEGPFLKEGEVSTYFVVAEFTDDYNETQGFASVLCLRAGDPDALGVDGDGVLATITFNSASNGGPESLHLAEVKLSDPNATVLPFVKVDGEVAVVPEYSIALILPLLAIATLTAVILRKRILNHRGIFHTA
jgi:hypothetical protein